MSTVRFVPYQSLHFNPCIELLRSNMQSYFAEEEVADFELFLNQDTNSNNYSVGLLENKVVACGGWGKAEDRYYLRWGIVDGTKHKAGLGTQLLEYRMNAILQEIGNVDIFIKTSGQAHGFFTRYGFHLQTITKDGLAKDFDEYLMKRPFDNR